jgi:sucrose phosphorylase
LAGDDLQYLFARAIQFFSPGVPQVYYSGLLAMHNDMALLEKTNVGRDINRPYLSAETVEAQLKLPVVKGLCQLIKLRNRSSAFNGEFSVRGEGNQLALYWENGTDEAILRLDLARQQGTITLKEDSTITHYDLTSMCTTND